MTNQQKIPMGRLRALINSLKKRTHDHDKQTTFTDDEFFAKASAALTVGICPHCTDKLSVKNISPDHIHPLVLGGTSDLNNIQFICSSCNEEKSGRPLATHLRINPEARLKRRKLNQEINASIAEIRKKHPEWYR